MIARLALVITTVTVLTFGVAHAATLMVAPEDLTIERGATSVPVTTCTLTATADAYVDENGPNRNANFGTSTLLGVRSDRAANRRAFLAFDIASCAVPPGASLQDAQLRLFMSQAPSADRSYEVRRVTAAWGETTVTWNNAPAVAGVTSSVATGTTSNVTLQWTVTADVAAFLSGTANNGWRVNDSVEDTNPGFFAGQLHSRENTTAPVLEITYYP